MLLGFWPAKVLSYDQDSHTAQIHVPGLTDGLAEGITADFGYPVGDDDRDTERQILPGADVDVYFERGQQEAPIIAFYRSHRIGGAKDTRRIRQKNIELLATAQVRIKGVGVDCGMLLCEVYHAVGLIPFIDPRPYPPDWYMHQMASKYLDWVAAYADPVTEPLAGDIALFHFGQCISHAAIVVEWPSIIHAYHGQGCILADATKGRLCSNLAGFWRIRETQA